MAGLGTLALAEADTEHLQQAAAYGTTEIGMGSDSIHKHNPIRLMRQTVKVERDAINLPKGNDIHSGAHRRPDGIRCDSQPPKDLDLPRRSRSALRPHRWNNKEGRQPAVASFSTISRTVSGRASMP